MNVQGLSAPGLDVPLFAGCRALSNRLRHRGGLSQFTQRIVQGRPFRNGKCIQSLVQTAHEHSKHEHGKGGHKSAEHLKHDLSPDHVFREDIKRTVIAVILAGGPGAIGDPLANARSLGALEVGGTIKLIDIPIGNCMVSGISKMYVLTQFNSQALNSHLATCYPPVMFGGPGKLGFVDVLACHQTIGMTGNGWYRGSADAVRRNIDSILDPHFGGDLPTDLLIISGTGVYNMDFGELLLRHRRTGADITIATTMVPWERAPRLGLVSSDPKTGRIRNFKEKPSQSELEQFRNAAPEDVDPVKPFQASMGVYVFKREVLEALLHENEEWMQMDTGPDVQFGKDVIPHALADQYKIFAHHFTGFWQEVSSLRDCLDVNLLLAGPNPYITIYDIGKGTRVGNMLPPTRWGKHAQVKHSLLGEGCVIKGAEIQNSVIGCNAYIEDGAKLEYVMILSNTFYSSEAGRAAQRAEGKPVVGIGAGTTIKKCVIETNASIGRNCVITPEDITDAQDMACEGKPWKVKDGIIFISRDAVIPDGTKIP